MVLHCQLEVGQGNGNEGGDDDEDDEDDEEDGVDGVDLVAPDAGKDVVQLNIDGAEWQEPCSAQAPGLPKDICFFGCAARQMKADVCIIKAATCHDLQC